MRRPSRARGGSASGELQMGPLIDCVFLLLTYFLFTISLATIEGLLPSELALGDELSETELELEEDPQEVIIPRWGSLLLFFQGESEEFDEPLEEVKVLLSIPARRDREKVIHECHDRYSEIVSRELANDESN